MKRTQKKTVVYAFLVTLFEINSFSDPHRNEWRQTGECTDSEYVIKNRFFAVKYHEDTPDNRTETRNESHASSLLLYIKDDKPKEKDLVEAFCRDVDSFNHAFKVLQSGDS